MLYLNMLLNQFAFRIFGFLAHRDFGKKFLLKYNIKASKEQESQYRSLGLDRSLGLMKLNTVLYELYGRTYSETNGMWSEHLILFSAISESNYKIKTILEIGTFNGETTRILSLLFPNSSIETLDLPFNEIKNDHLYKYVTKNKELIKKRDQNLISLANVKFIEMNSLELIRSQEKYDLIWVDGDHSNPVVSIDIANAIRLLKPKGLSICDDVYLATSNLGKYGRSSAAFETLDKYAKAKVIKFTLLRKRIGFFYNSPKKFVKYLAIVAEPNNH
jgi:predicted O-methyltransferase YrrM